MSKYIKQQLILPKRMNLSSYYSYKHVLHCMPAKAHTKCLRSIGYPCDIMEPKYANYKYSEGSECSTSLPVVDQQIM